MKVNELNPNPENPRTITEMQLANLKKSFERFGNLSGVVFNRRFSRLAGGHQTIKTLPPEAEITILRTFEIPTNTGTVAEGFITTGIDRIPYREVDWDLDNEKAANLAANQHGGEFDMNKVNNWLLELSDNGFDLSLTGFSDLMLSTIEPLDLDEKQNNKDDKESFHSLEVQFSNEQDMIIVYEELLSRGFVTRIK